ncbi:hypothetical protein JXA63_05210 [Candidatus Woesebacteria bacterium]|nr:hypothetical protein [Candidatus Woesebacteria bacterium]
MGKKPRWKNESEFNEFLVGQYLRYGSVDEVLKKNNFDIPISYANYHRILDKWGIIKAAGPNSKLNESLDFLYQLAQTNIPFDSLYTKMPSSFKTSAATLYRVLSYIKEGITRRVGTGLIITPHDNETKVLLGSDRSTPRDKYGKTYGALTIPIGFSRIRDLRKDAILRVLQQEVFAENAIEQKMPDIIPESAKPFMFLDIADVRVEVFHIVLPKRLSNAKCFSSFKLYDHRFMSLETILRGDTKTRKYRAGIISGAMGYKKYLELKKRNLTSNPLYIKSRLNYQLSSNLQFQEPEV